ncbi:MAG: Gx transporter family protein [Acholeplasmatales bacterium]|nr:Gx transporter family protein [Acholeplasmatales bacterium]
MKNIGQLALSAIFIGLAAILSYIERFIPIQLVIPLPGVKLGLANIVTLVSLYLLDKKQCIIILIIRCLIGAMFGGGFTGLMHSLTGGVFAIIIMIITQRIRLFSIYGVSVFGAAFHHIGQIIVSMLLMKSIYIGSYLPYLLLVGVFTGLLTATISSKVVQALESNPKIKKLKENEEGETI